MPSTALTVRPIGSRIVRATQFTNGDRRRIARLFKVQGGGICHLAWLATNASRGPDPESALVYLRDLHSICDALLGASSVQPPRRP